MKKQLYLVSNYVTLPKDKSQTRFAGYLKNEDNLTMDEQVAVTTKLKNRDYSTARIILNLSEKKIIKSSYTGPIEFDQLWKYFKTNYADQLKSVLQYVEPETVVAAPAAEETGPSTVETSAVVTSPVSSTVSS